MIKSRYINKVIAIVFIGIFFLAIYPTSPQPPVQFIDRSTGELKTEKIAGENWLLWLYHNPVGEATLWSLVKRKAVSSVYGKLMDGSSSAKKIMPFVEEFDIDLSIAADTQFNSFNEFFTRKLKPGARRIDTGKQALVSPADGKLLVYDDIQNSDFIIKGQRFDVISFLEDVAQAERYKDGSLIVIRLAPNDYHRFHFPVNGVVTDVSKIEGDYYSVNPLALREMIDIFCMNKREITRIQSVEYGQVLMVEVGATMVGSIVQTFTDNDIHKGEEKGYFEFGGSTVVLLFEKARIRIDNDLLLNTSKGLETSVLMGERFGIGTSTMLLK